MSEIPELKEPTEAGRLRQLVRLLPTGDQESLLLAALHAVSDMETLIGESAGVYGLHLNGDVAPWSDLTMGGKYEEWLHSLAVASISLGLAYEKYLPNAEAIRSADDNTPTNQ